jgi:hypothetical protein
MDTGYASIREAARRANVTSERLRRAVLEGDLVAIPVADDRQYLVRLADVQRLIRAADGPIHLPEQSPRRMRRSPSLFPVVVLAILCSVVALFSFWVGALLGVILVFVYMVRSWRSALTAFLLGPWFLIPAFWFAWGTVTYFTGTGVLMGFGLPGLEYHNLDRDLRCPRRSSG